MIASVRSVYLAVANEVQAVGWTYILFSTLFFGLSGCWDRLSTLLLFLQALCCFDIVHACLGWWGDDNGLSLWQRLW